MKQGRTLFVAAAAAEAKAKAARGNGERSFEGLRIQLAGQALAGLGGWTPYPEDWDGMTGPTHADLARWRAQIAVAQADAMLVALGLVEEENPS